MKINNKIISSLFILIFIILFSFLNYNEYKYFHIEKYENKQYIKQLEQKINNFNVQNIKKINYIKIYHTPNKDLLDKIVELINNAEKEILLETYMLTETRIQDALINSFKKWIKIQIILEKSPYMSYNINNKAYNKLKNYWIDIVWSNKDNYSFNHSKILLIDNLSIISTWNYTYSTFTKNRDFFIFTKDYNINKKLKENFFYDFIWKNISIYDDNLIFSPSSSRIKIEKLFNSAEKDIKMYFQYIEDDNLLDKLIFLKKEKKINISIILPESAKNNENTKILIKNWVNIWYIKDVTMHAKSILIDEKYLFIWSINFSTNSIDKNREIWVLIINNEIIDYFLSIFNNDLNNN